MREPPIRVCLFAKEVGVADAIVRALDSDFETRHRSEFDLHQWSDWPEWCDVFVLDMRHGRTADELSAGIRLIEQIQRGSPRAPVIVFCDESNTALTARVSEQGAHEVITDGLNIANLRRIMRRAPPIRSAE